jgi:hypothetical protein
MCGTVANGYRFENFTWRYLATVAYFEKYGWMKFS